MRNQSSHYLLPTTVLLVNGQWTMEHAAAGPACKILLMPNLFRDWVMGNGETTTEHDTLPAPGAACATEIVLLMGGRWRWQWRMEKDLSHLVPAAWARITSDAHIYLPMGRRTMGNGANGGSNDPWKDIQ